MKQLWSSAIFLLFIFLSCSTDLSAQSDRTPLRTALRISVFVRLASGSPAPVGINVRLEAEPGGLVDQQMTDSSGKVTFIPKNFTTYAVTIHEAGYRDAVGRVDLTMTPTAAVSLTLVPLAKDDAAKPVNGENVADPVSAASLSIPEPARKEFAAGRKLLETKHDPSGSIPHFRKAIQLYEGFSQAHVMLGLAYLQDQRLKEAQTALERAVQLDPKSAAGHLTLGACLNQQKNYVGAEKALLAGLELEPESPEGHYELAKNYWAQRRWQEADPHVRKAEELKPQVPGVHVLMGNILLQKRDNPGALREFNEYLRLDPKGSMSETVRAMVVKLESASPPQ
jgi:cytochrome c-type biogenesis protein CcmH/NrfG